MAEACALISGRRRTSVRRLSQHLPAILDRQAPHGLGPFRGGRRSCSGQAGSLASSTSGSRQERATSISSQLSEPDRPRRLPRDRRTLDRDGRGFDLGTGAPGGPWSWESRWRGLASAYPLVVLQRVCVVHDTDQGPSLPVVHAPDAREGQIDRDLRPESAGPTIPPRHVRVLARR